MGIINYAYGNLLTIHQQDEVNDIIRQAIERTTIHSQRMLTFATLKSKTI